MRLEWSMQGALWFWATGQHAEPKQDVSCDRVKFEVQAKVLGIG